MLGAALKRGGLVGLAIAGLALSLLLEVLHVRAYLSPAASSFCSLANRFDCMSVALSRYAVVGGVPLALWGALGFAAIGTAAWQRSAWLVPLTAVAAVASVLLFFVELLEVEALCLVCEAVHVTALAAFFVAWRGRRGLVPRARDDAALIFLPPLGVLLGLVLFLRPYWAVFSWKGDVPFPEGVTNDGAHWIGARNPTLTLDEYTDYLCSHCKAATEWTLRRMAARPTEIRLVRRQYPLAACRADRPGTCTQLRLAYCAEEQGHFWHMDRWLFAHNDQFRPKSEAAAHDLGIDAARLASCVERADIYARAEREARATAKRHFLGTPTYMVGEKRISTETADHFLAQGRPD